MRHDIVNRKRQRFLTALDVGSSKISCLIVKPAAAPDWLEAKAIQFISKCWVSAINAPKA